MEKRNLKSEIIFYREARTSDIDQILEVQKAAIKDIWVGEKYGITEEMVDKSYTKESKEEMKKYFDSGKYYVAKVENQIVGVISAGDNGHIYTMWILPTFQSRGIGSKLLSLALDYLKDKPEIYLETGYQQDGRAFKFYEKFGFKKTGKERLVKLYPEQKREIENVEFVLKK